MTKGSRVLTRASVGAWPWCLVPVPGASVQANHRTAPPHHPIVRVEIRNRATPAARVRGLRDTRRGLVRCRVRGRRPRAGDSIIGHCLVIERSPLRVRLLGLRQRRRRYDPVLRVRSTHPSLRSERR